MKIESTEELEVIRPKAKRKDVDLNDMEKQCLSVVYEEITKKVQKVKRATLNLSCSSCVRSAINLVYNYITYHEEREVEVPQEKAKVTIVENQLPQYEVVIDEDESTGVDRIEFTSDAYVDAKQFTFPTDLDKPEKLYADKTLKELRELFPDIKKRSKEDFIQAIKDANKRD